MRSVKLCGRRLSRNLTFNAKVVEQRLGTGVLSHHNPQASLNGDEEEHRQNACPYSVAADVQLIIGVLFISISATVTPASLHHLGLPTLGLVAVLVLVTRPLVAWVATVRTTLTRGERQFTGWMAPRGIVAAATASTFSAQLVAHNVGGASKILPVTFLVIVATVALYGLTAVRPADGPAWPGRPAPGRCWSRGSLVIDLAQALRSGGLDVILWAGFEQQREQIRHAGLELAHEELMPAATTAVPSLRASPPCFCSPRTTSCPRLRYLAGSIQGPVYPLRAAARPGVVAPYTRGEALFAASLTRYQIRRRRRRGGTSPPARRTAGSRRAGELLFMVGRTAPWRRSREQDPGRRGRGTLVLLGPAKADS